MAFMEKPPAGKVLLDDTVPLTAQIEASQSLHSHTVSGADRRTGRAAERGGSGRCPAGGVAGRGARRGSGREPGNGGLGGGGGVRGKRGRAGARSVRRGAGLGGGLRLSPAEARPRGAEGGGGAGAGSEAVRGLVWGCAGPWGGWCGWCWGGVRGTRWGRRRAETPGARVWEPGEPLRWGGGGAAAAWSPASREVLGSVSSSPPSGCSSCRLPVMVPVPPGARGAATAGLRAASGWCPL